MRLLATLASILVLPSLTAQDEPLYVYSSFDSRIWAEYHHPFAGFFNHHHYNEIDWFEFEEQYGQKLQWTCTPLGNALTNVNTREYAKRVMKLSDKDAGWIFKGVIVLSESRRNDIWKLNYPDGRHKTDPFPTVYCTTKIGTPEQRDKFSKYFSQYAKKRLDLPWYEGILSELLGKLSLGWSAGKSAFDLLLERKSSEIISAAALTQLMAVNGQFQRVIFFDEGNWNTFDLSTIYTAHVENDIKNIVLYTTTYQISPTKRE